MQVAHAKPPTIDLKHAREVHRTQCSYCQKVLEGAEWVENTEPQDMVSHGVCPSCQPKWAQRLELQLALLALSESQKTKTPA